MRKSQDSCKIAWALVCLALVALPLKNPAFARPSDPILTGEKPGPCDPKLESPDYVGGVDVDGNRITPADIDGGVSADLSHVAVTPIQGRDGGHGKVAVQGVKLTKGGPDCVAPKHGKKHSAPASGR
jgi:hypothetical protein